MFVTFRIALEPAHLILARSCLGILLNLDVSVDGEYNESSDEDGNSDGLVSVIGPSLARRLGVALGSRTVT